MIKWAYVNTLLNPVLSDSFGLSMGVSSYFYLGLAVPRILGAVLLWVNTHQIIIAYNRLAVSIIKKELDTSNNWAT